jgi:uncharacterized protein (DUF983 family)
LLEHWANLFDLGVLFLIFIMAAVVVFSFVWVKYSK